MSPRGKRIRKIFGPPAIKALKPIRRRGGAISKEPVLLNHEEYESIKLCDYDLLNHLEASEIMGVSRPTFTRIYSAARQKVAKAFVEVREIIVEGGKVYYDSEWFNCKACTCDFNHHNKLISPKNCPLCGSVDVSRVVLENPGKEILKCICTNCGDEFDSMFDSNCAKLVCPTCGHSVCNRN